MGTRRAGGNILKGWGSSPKGLIGGAWSGESFLRIRRGVEGKKIVKR